MPQFQPDSDSDSDSDYHRTCETSVLLGIPDGALSSTTDLTDAAVSRIGGRPAFLTSPEPSMTSSLCNNCSNPMELLVQIWCPFENSPMDRALYIWGCARGSCKSKEGSVRAWRGLRYNHPYAIKLEKKLAQKKEKAKTATAEMKPTPKANPFSMSSIHAPNHFSLGAQTFGVSQAPSPPPESPPSSDDEDESSQSSNASTASLLVVPTMQPASSPWHTTPTYPPLYLSTTSEYLLPPPKPSNRIPEIDEDEKNSKEWTALESYESSLCLDPIFAKFTTRISHEPTQCIRYELNGIPLPYTSDNTYDTLFPLPTFPPPPTTKQVFKVTLPMRRTYHPSVAPCTHCGSRRVFECQLMPNLINVVDPFTNSSQSRTEEERRKELQQLLKKSEEKGRMEWGTCMVFSCEKDCCISDESGKADDCWREEIVLIQWDE